MRNFDLLLKMLFYLSMFFIIIGYISSSGVEVVFNNHVLQMHVSVFYLQNKFL